MSTKYRPAIQTMIRQNGRRLIVNMDDLRTYDKPFSIG